MGDVEDFKQELSKICSNAPINEKIGRVEVNGLHSEKVKLWLRRLGFWSMDDYLKLLITVLIIKFKIKMYASQPS